MKHIHLVGKTRQEESLTTRYICWTGYGAIDDAFTRSLPFLCCLAYHHLPASLAISTGAFFGDLVILERYHRHRVGPRRAGAESSTQMLHI